MRHTPILLCLALLPASPGYAQTKTACELLSKADAEAVLGLSLQPPKPLEPFRSLLDQDFAVGDPRRRGKKEEGCAYTNSAPDATKPPKRVDFFLEVRYSPTPNPRAVDDARTQVDKRTYEHPTDLPDLGDAAFWIGPANNVSLFVFRGGTMRLLIGPSQIGLEHEKALALKVLGGPGKTGYAYGTSQASLSKPVLSALGPKPDGLEPLKRQLAAKANAGDAKAQLALGKVYQFGALGPDGSAKPDYAGAAYWYQQASDHGEAEAAYSLGVIYREGLGVPANPSAALELFRKAADAGFVPAMAPLSYAYAAAATSVSPQRATYWATKAAEAGDPEGWLILGYEYNEGMLGGERPYWYQMAMDAYKKAADGGNCIAMMNIGGLYFNGDGVPQDKIRAQSWFAKAESCHGEHLEWMRDTAAKYRARAGAGRLPAVVPETAPVKGGAALSDGQKLIVGFAALLVVAAAIDQLNPSSGRADIGGHAAGDNALADWNDWRQRETQWELCVLRTGKLSSCIWSRP